MNGTNMKKLLSCILAMAMVFSLIPCAFASGTDEEPETFQFEDYKYIVVDGKACIKYYSGTNYKLCIPQKMNGYEVTTIGDYAFEDCSSLASIEIPSSVTKIGDYAFSYCKSLTSIEIPDSVAKIGANPFACCENLKQIIVSPDHPALAVIGNALFSKADKRLVTYLQTAYNEYAVPNGIITIGEEAFYRCESLTSIEIPDSITTIGNEAFRGCRSLLSIEIPSSVTAIGNWAFGGCYSLTSIEIPDSVPSIGYRTFGGCGSLTRIKIPDSVATIGDWAFEWCTSLRSIEIPSSVTSIGYEAFEECNSLTMKVERDSYAAKWAQENGYPIEYPDSLDWLNN